MIKKFNEFVRISNISHEVDKLVDIYTDFGFVSYQKTEEDGTIMVLIYKK